MTEFWVTIIGLAVGSVKSLMEQSIKNNQARWDAIQKANSAEISAQQEARKMNDPGVQFTRRLLAILMVCGVVIAPVVYAFIYPYNTVNVPVLRKAGGFIAWIFGDQEAVKYIAMNGMTYVTQFNHAVLLIIGFYFGSGGTRK